jgi:hypothetical protein
MNLIALVITLIVVRCPAMVGQRLHSHGRQIKKQILNVVVLIVVVLWLIFSVFGLGATSRTSTCHTRDDPRRVRGRGGPLRMLTGASATSWFRSVKHNHAVGGVLLRACRGPGRRCHL